MSRWIALLTILGLAASGSVCCRSNGTADVEETPAANATTAIRDTADTTATTTQPADEPKLDQETGFAQNAFPPTMPDTDWHRSGWVKDDCTRCHDTGVENAPRIVHRSLPEIALAAKCRSCHVLIPGQKPRGAKKEPEDDRFAANAFPPLIPASGSHESTWTKDDCLLCHETGLRKAPVVRHEGLPRILLQAKCRSCHVQVRAVDQ